MGGCFLLGPHSLSFITIILCLLNGVRSQLAKPTMRPPQSIVLFLLWLNSQCVLGALRSYNFTIHEGDRAPDGVMRKVYLINDQQPGPLIEADEGDDLEIFVQNNLRVEQTIHWHGLLQRGTAEMDGVPGVTQFPIPANGNFTYRFSTASEYGFFWYHSHFRAYYNDAVRGPLIIHPSPSRRRPFESLAADSAELDTMLRVERDATPILLTDWYHRSSDLIFEEYFTTGAFPQCVDSLLANGQGRVQCLPENVLQAGPGLGIQSYVANDPHDPEPMEMSTPMPSQSMSSMSSSETSNSKMPIETMSASTMSMSSMSMDPSMSMRKRSEHTAMTMPMSDSPASDMGSPTASMSGMSDMSTLGPKGCSMPMMFMPGFNASSLPLETCSNTTSDVFMFDVDASRGWAAFHLVNAAAVSRMSVSLDGHSMIVYAADGLYVEPQEVKVLHISIGQRYSVMVRLDQQQGMYSLRFASYPYGDMQQIIEGHAMMSYMDKNMTSGATLVEEPSLTWMLVNGSAKLDASELDDQKLAPFEGVSPPNGPSNVTQLFTINQTGIVTWVVNDQAYSEPTTPIIYGSVSDGWDSATTLRLPGNATIDLIMHVANDSMDVMGHPIHLHGHKFWFLGAGQGMFPYNSVDAAPSSMINLENPPYRDTIDLPASGWAVVRYVTDNPGAWLLHCHVQWHLVSGMAVVLVENEEQMLTMVGSIENAANNPNMPGMQSGGLSLTFATKPIFLFLAILLTTLADLPLF